MKTGVLKALSKLVENIWRWDLPPAIMTLILYLRTLAPGVYGFDSAELTTGAFTPGIVHPTGYPLYLLLGKVATFLPVRNVAFRVNLLSAVLGALTVWLLVRVIHRLIGHRWAAWFGGLSLAVSYAFWDLSTVAEVYTLQTTLSSLILLASLRWLDKRKDLWLYVSIFFCGLSLTNHVSAAFLFPIVIIPVLKYLSPREILRRTPFIVLFFLIGLVPYVYLPIRYLADPPLNYVASYYQVNLSTWSGFWWMISGAAYRFFAFGYSFSGYLHEIANFGGMLVRNFTGLGVGLGLVGLGWLLHRRTVTGISILLAFLVNVGFFAGYAVADKGTMFLPTYILWAIWIGVGVWRVVICIRKASTQLGPTARWGPSFVQGGLTFSLLIIGGLNWNWLDKSDIYGPELFARQVFQTVEADSLVMGPWSSAVVLEYFQQVEGLRPDVEIFNRSRYQVAEYYKYWAQNIPHDQAVEQILSQEKMIIQSSLSHRPTYDLEYYPRLATTFEYQPVGRVFMVSSRSSID